jgi:hypothetical protein
MVATRETQSRFDLLERRYPIGLNRIDWRGVRNHRVIDVLEMKSGQEVDHGTHVRKLQHARGALVELLATAGGGEQADVTWFGDDYDLSLSMQPRTLLECYVTLFATPQHSYVIPDGAEWCLNYTMEGVLYIGRAADALVAGPVNLGDDETGGPAGRS